jgi:O-methyltransferase involved in polyketide biosynthesis
MSALTFIRTEFTAAIARGVRQCVILGSQPLLREAFDAASYESLRVFKLHEDSPVPQSGTSVSARIETETLATKLETLDFDKRKASLFLWLGGTGDWTADAIFASLAFVASLPKGTAVLLDYVTERAAIGSLAKTALDALASSICSTEGVKYLIQPQAVAAMLRAFGFQHVADVSQDEWTISGAHLVSAVV